LRLLLFQNGVDRGWVLKGVDDVLVLLEDMGLNLQVRGWNSSVNCQSDLSSAPSNCSSPSTLH
jgi:hypothetical protein